MRCGRNFPHNYMGSLIIKSLSSHQGPNHLSTPLFLALMWQEVSLSLIPKTFTDNDPRLDPPTCCLHSPAPLDLSPSYPPIFFKWVFFRIFTHQNSVYPLVPHHGLVPCLSYSLLDCSMKTTLSKSQDCHYLLCPN
jgi:hypothetical protein